MSRTEQVRVSGKDAESSILECWLGAGRRETLAALSDVDDSVRRKGSNRTSIATVQN